jgi:hypothetical protein
MFTTAKISLGNKLLSLYKKATLQRVAFFVGLALAPNCFAHRARAPGCHCNATHLASGFLAILVSLAASLRQPPKNGKNHAPKWASFPFASLAR